MQWQREKTPSLLLLELNPGHRAYSLVSILTELKVKKSVPKHHTIKAHWG